MSEKISKPRIYLETSVISYLVARPSRDLIVAANQQMTHEWWEMRRTAFDVFISELVVQEVSNGDITAAQRRLEVLANIPLLILTPEAVMLADRLIQEGPLPLKAGADAMHIAIATVNGMDYLLTWNCTHLANAAFRARIEQLCREQGYEPSIICTPQELLEE